MTRRIFTTMLALAILVVIFAGYARMKIDSANNVVELALDFRDLTELSTLSGRSISDLLDEVKKAGVNDIAIYEDTILDLTQNGKAAYLSGAEIKSFYPTNAAIGQKGFSVSDLRAGYQYILFTDTEAGRRAYVNLKTRYGSDVVKMIGDRLIEIGTVELEIETLSMGYDPEMVSLIHAKGFDTVAVLRNDGRLGAEGLETIVRNIRQIGAKTALSLGKEVAGFAPPGANLEVSIADLAQALGRAGISLGFLEMVTMEGKSTLIEEAGKNGVKIHEVAEWRTIKSTPAEVITTIKTAVRDRSIRLIYLRLFLKGATGPKMAQRNISFLNELNSELVSSGYEIGSRSTPKAPDKAVANLLLPLSALATLAGPWLLLIDSLKNRFRSIFFAISLLIAAVFLLFGKGPLFVKGLSLLAASIFPTLAMILFEKDMISHKVGAKRYASASLSLFKASSVTLLGGLIVSSLLMREDFLLGVDSFTGVKVAYLLPLLAVASLLSLKWQPVKGGLKAILDEPILLKYVMAGFLALAALAFYIIRSGNAAAEFVPASELILRRLLDNIMLVRPRFKEFLIGHPAFILAASGLFKRKTTYGLAVLATIGQISLLNTFCHIYSPLWVSLLRSFNGLLLGLLFGLVVAYAYEKTSTLIKNA